MDYTYWEVCLISGDRDEHKVDAEGILKNLAPDLYEILVDRFYFSLIGQL